jgi:hypothetical protein
MIAGADGTFRLDGLGEGTWYLQACQGPGRLPMQPRRVVVGKEAVSGITLKLPRQFDVKGHVDAPLPPGTLLALNRSGGEFGGEMTTAPPVPLDADGHFVLAGVSRGLKRFTLLVPQPVRAGCQIALACPGVPVDPDNTEITVVPRERLGHIHGQVTCAKGAVPMQRLAVFARPEVQQRPPDLPMEPSCPVRANGTFDLVRPSTTCFLAVRDTLTGLLLGEPLKCRVETDGVTTVELPIEAGEVRLRLQEQDANDNGPAVLLRIAAADDSDDIWWRVGNPRIGLDLRDAAEETTVYLKPGPTSLRLQYGSLATPAAGGPVMGDVLQEIAVQAGSRQELALRIPRRHLH